MTVVRRVESRPLVLSDGARQNFALNQGKYEVEVKVRSGNTKYGVVAKWVGGKGCSDHAESQEVHSSCMIENTGAVIIENPTAFGLGPVAEGVVSIYVTP